jgi:hypothetical protein
MPLYTYIVAFRGATYAAQARHSNFNGFVSSWSTDLPDNVFPGLTASLKNELSGKAYRSDFLEGPNRKNVWRKTLNLDGEDFTVYAVQTES